MNRRRLGAVICMFLFVASSLLASVAIPAGKAAALVPVDPSSSFSVIASVIDDAHVSVLASGTTVVNGVTVDVSKAQGVYYDRNANDGNSNWALGGDKKVGVPSGCTASTVKFAANGTYDSSGNPLADLDLFLPQVAANSTNCVEFKLPSQTLYDAKLGFDLNKDVSNADLSSMPSGAYRYFAGLPADSLNIGFYIQDSNTIVKDDSDPTYDSSPAKGDSYVLNPSTGDYLKAPGTGCPDYIKITSANAVVDQANYIIQKGTGSGTCGVDKTYQLAVLPQTPTATASSNGAVPPGDTGSSNNNGGANECGITNELAWVACPILNALNWFTSELDTAMGNLLTIDTGQIFNATGQYYTAWSSIRDLAVGLIIVSSLVAIGAEALGMEIFGAYALRKVLPRTLIVAVAITLAWPLLEFVVTFFNNMGNWVGDIITSPFNGLTDYSYSNGVEKALGLTGGAIVGSIAAVGAYWAAGGVGGLLSLVATAALGLLIGFITLVIRNMIVILAIIVSPLAIAAYILPGTQKLWTFWKDTFITALAMFPIVMAFVSSGKVFSHIEEASNSNGILKAAVTVIAYVVPYFLLPLAFKMAGGLVATITGMVNDKSRGGFDRLKNFRQESASRMHQERMTDKNGNTRTNNVYRRLAMAGQGGLMPTARGRAKYRANRQRLQNAATSEMVENDAGRAGGDDDATAVASQEGVTRASFIRDYAARTGRGQADAQNALAQMESNFGAKMGSSAMQSAAFKARAASVTGYTNPNDPNNLDPALAELMNDARRMRANGNMTATDIASSIKANKGRGDQSSIGFGQLVTQINRDGPTTADQVTEMRDNALAGMLPGALASQRHETVSAMAPTIRRNLHNAAAAIETHAVGSDERQRAVREFKRQMASASGLYDTMAQVSPQNARILDEQVMSQALNVGHIPELAGLQGTRTFQDAPGVTSGPVTIQSANESLRNDSDYTGMRREYGAAASAQAAAIQNQQGGGQGGPPGISPIQPIR